jgi:sporulation protein YlmC with PRC-barrel domain
MNRLHVWPAAFALAFPLAFTASAQEVAQPLEDAPILDLNAWNYDRLYQEGLRGTDLLDADVQGPNGDEIGDVENVIIDGDGKILSIIAEVGGFLDIGDTHVNVPWDEVEFVEGTETIRIPVTEDTVENYSLFDSHLSASDAQQTKAVDDDLETGPRAWKLYNLIGDYAMLQEGVGYGYVDDVLFDRNGQISAVVVSRDVGYGTPGLYAYPYYGYGRGWAPGTGRYDMPYNRDQADQLQPFDYNRMGGGDRS